MWIFFLPLMWLIAWIQPNGCFIRECDVWTCGPFFPSPKNLAAVSSSEMSSSLTVIKQSKPSCNRFLSLSDSRIKTWAWLRYGSVWLPGRADRDNPCLPTPRPSLKAQPLLALDPCKALSVPSCVVFEQKPDCVCASLFCLPSKGFLF